MWFLAFRYLIARKRQSLLTLLGVALGTAAFVTFSAIMTGFQDFIIDQLVNNDSHVRISAKDERKTIEEFQNLLFPESVHTFWISPPTGTNTSTKIAYPLGWYDQLKRDPRILSFAPQIGAQVLYSKGGNSRAGRLQGILPEPQSRVTNLENYIIEGSYKAVSMGGNRILIGKGLADRLGARINDSILISSGTGSPVPFKIVGIFKLGIQNLDDSFTFAHLRDVQAAVGRPSEITDIVIKLVDVDLAQEFANSYAATSNDTVKSWSESNANILSVFSLQDFIRSFITIAIMVVASFGVYNILNILVNQKQRDIGILRSMGYDDHEVQFLFLVQGLTLGILGGVIGLAFGFGMSLYLSTLKITGMLDNLMVNFSLRIYYMGFSMALFSSVISSYLPARAAGKLKPIDIIRSGE